MLKRIMDIMKKTEIERDVEKGFQDQKSLKEVRVDALSLRPHPSSLTAKIMNGY